jgi:phenylpropionate dioxygenase-like ring-hydroxylating dioxygenase large terminal subunit
LITPAASFFASDRGDVPKSLLESSVRDYGTGLFGKDCYISPEWHRREVERLWGKVWQLACLEQDIPNTGDHLEYVIANQSILVVRDADGGVRAFFNVCRHRGSRLKVGCGHSKEIRCSFHAWAWNLDGTLKDIPCRWDFPSVRDEEFGLKACKVSLWNGLVFINLDPDAESFESFLGPDLMRHFAEWPSLGTRWKAVHVAKEIHCNWKLAIEAFVEAYHAFTIHPQWTNYAGDLNAQYDAYGKHARVIVPLGVPSPHRRTPITEQEIVNSMITTEFADAWGKSDGGPLPIPKVPEGGTARATLSDFRKRILAERTGVDYSQASDAQMLDLIEYWVFPNACIWVGEGGPLIYRARPNGNNPESCIWETMILLPIAEGQTRPPAAKVNFIPADKSYAEGAPEVGTSAKVFEQDSSNLTKMQLGLHSQGFPGPMFGKYMEMNIRQFHQNLERLMSDEPAEGR